MSKQVLPEKKQVSVQLSGSMLEFVERQAEQRGGSAAEVIRQCIHDAMRKEAILND